MLMMAISTPSDIVLIALIAAAPGFISALGTLVNGWMIGRINRHTLDIRNKVNEVEKNTNSKMDQLLELKGTSEFAKGIKDQKDRQAEIDRDKL